MLDRAVIGYIEFRDPPPRYDFVRDVLIFAGMVRAQQTARAINREALDDWLGVEGKEQEAYLKVFRNHRDQIQAMTREIYLNDPVSAGGAVLIKRLDVSRLPTRKKPSDNRRRKSRV
jgi:hypothetical protein